mmetsp:Transcript_13973/g.23753  ORF Transcript_13973/g.23753 Transcript_13973/m.23753 type:complete len:162 (-) Transcript_13973:147-632(-)
MGRQKSVASEFLYKGGGPSKIAGLGSKRVGPSTTGMNPPKAEMKRRASDFRGAKQSLPRNQAASSAKPTSAACLPTASTSKYQKMLYDKINAARELKDSEVSKAASDTRGSQKSGLPHKQPHRDFRINTNGRKAVVEQKKMVSSRLSQVSSAKPSLPKAEV